MNKIIITSNADDDKYWHTLWGFRELLYIFGWRDLNVRYKQTIVGLAWTILRPTLTIAIFSFVFGKIANLSSPNGIPYVLIVFSGLLPWQLFSNSLQAISDSLVSNSNLITKIYFPRLIIPLSALAVPLIEFLISFLIFSSMLMYFNQAVSFKFLFLIPILFVIVVLSVGPGLILSTLNVHFRDFRYLIPFCLQIGFYISPVGYLTDNVPSDYQAYYDLNPLVGIIDATRWSVLNQGEFPLISFAKSLIASCVFLIIGIIVFRKFEKNFADSV